MRRHRSYSINPFVQSIFTADPSAHVWNDGRLYVYPSRDIDPAQGCDFMDKYHAFSTTDMVNWRDEGELFDSSKSPWGRPSGGFMWAPDCAYRNGYYYFFYPHPSEEAWNDSWKIGVARSTSPTQGFEDLGYIEGVGGFAMIDPAVFVDDDNTPYFYYGGGGHCMAAVLNDDMHSLKTPLVPMEGLGDFHEASWTFKRNGIYYLTYSDNHSGNNHLCYAMSDKPLGPWQAMGPYLAPTNCETSHGSVVEYKGQWYAFYHSDDLSQEGVLRSICVDPVEFNEDGTMRLVVQSRNGRLPLADAAPTPLGQLQAYGLNEAKLTGVATRPFAGNYEDLATEPIERAEQVVTFDAVDGFATGRVNLGFHYATPAKLAKLQLFVNGKFETLLNLPFSGALDNFDGFSNYTITIRPGKVNQISIKGYEGTFALEALSVEDYGE
ncbi:family 43 glycosylhydrolase [Lacticaseibacillus suihuaensis]